MKKFEFIFALIVSLALGAIVAIIILYDSDIRTFGPSSEVAEASSDNPTAEDSQAALAAPTATSASKPMAVLASPTSLPTLMPTPSPTPIVIGKGSEKGEDLVDVLLLYDSNHVTNFDINFCRIAEYYGLLCKSVAIDSANLTDDLLRDTQGNYFRLVGISASALRPTLLTNDELDLIRSAIATEGVNLFVSKLNADQDANVLAELSEGAVLGAAEPQDSRRDWYVSAAAPEITLEFTDQVISFDQALDQEDSAIILGKPERVTILISSTDNTGAAYPIFVRWEKAAGSIFVDAGARAESLKEYKLTELYYGTRGFSKVIPLMFAVRYAFGDEVWHNDHSYANLTIDDPPLKRNMSGNLRHMDYQALLGEMRAHNFHTTIAFIPRNWDNSDPEVVQIFLNNPDKYSLVQHGNKSDGYEFYKYEVSEEDAWPARPLSEQREDILEGLARMGMHEQQSGIPFDKIMVFPYGISPEQTLIVLKENNYIAVVQGNAHPLDAPHTDRWDFLMYSANLDYGNFPMVRRRAIPDVDEYDPLTPVYRLFLDRPALLNSHVGEMFWRGIDTFSPIAAQINDLYGNVEWHSLGYIIRHLHLEKVNDDGSIDIQMYTNHLILTNESDEEKTYHVTKEESLNVPISSLVVNGRAFPYMVENGFLELDARIPANSSMEIVIHYGKE